MGIRIPLVTSSKQKTTSQITKISFVALLLGHLMLKTYVPNEVLNLLGLFITSYYIFYTTLRKNDLFSFLMVMYFCSTVPFLVSRGGGFNMICFVCIGMYLLVKKKFPAEKRLKDVWFNRFVGLLALSSILGWFFNYSGNGLDFIYSFLTFFGIIFLLFLSSRIEITPQRIKVFLQLNFVLIIYSTIVSINKQLEIITFSTHMMSLYGKEAEYFEGGGLVGGSPWYGEHSLILLMLFSIFYLFNKQKVNIKRASLLIAAIISYINIFMSISRSVFLLSIGGLVLMFLLQFKIVKIKIATLLQQIIVILLFGFSVLIIVESSGIDYVFDRMDDIEETNIEAGGITINRILDGSAFNRGAAFEVAKERYISKNSWIIGYGWGTEKNNRDAFYIDPSIKRGSAHSQVIAILFIFGWIGSIAYWSLILKIIIKAFQMSGNKKVDYVNRVMAYFFLIAFCLFTINEIKLDSISLPTYFAVTIIWMGLAYSTFNCNRRNALH